MDSKTKVVLTILLIEFFLLIGGFYWLLLRKKKSVSVLPDSDLVEIQNVVKKFEVDRRRSKFKRIK